MRTRPAALVVVLVACGGAGRSTDPPVVAVAAQPCARPMRSFGVGVVVADGVVATAAHTVDGPLRNLSVDGRAATVRTLDERTDLALLDVDTAAEPLGLTNDVPSVAVVHTTNGTIDVDIVRTGPLIVHDTTARARHEREAHTFMPGVTAGTSGSPLVDDDGRLLGIVVLDNPDDDVGYAVTAAELAALLERPAGSSAPPGCPG